MLPPDDFLVALTRLLEVQLIISCLESDRHISLVARVESGVSWRSVEAASEMLPTLSDMGGCSPGRRCLLVCDDYRQMAILPTSAALLLPHAGNLSDHRLAFSFDSHLMTFEASDNGTVLLYEWYRDGHHHIDIPIASWTAQDELKSLSPVRRRDADLNGLTVTVSIVEEPGFIYVNQEGRLDGMYGELLAMLQEILNFDVRLVFPADGMYGTLENNSWNGIIDQLLRGGADLSAAGHAMSAERVEAVDFGHALFATEMTLLVAAGNSRGHQSWNFMAFINIFELDIWLCIAFSVLAITVAHVLFERRQSSHHAHVGKSVLNGLHASFMSLIQQSGDEFERLCLQTTKPNSLSSRIAFLVANLSFFLLFALYTSDLTATMTAGMPPVTISSFHDVLANKLTVAYVKGGLEENLFSSAKPGSDMKRVHLDLSEGVSSFEDMRKEILKSGGEVVGYGPTLISLADTVPVRRFAEAVPIQGCFIFVRGSPLVEPMNQQFLKIRQSGVLNMIIGNWLYDRVSPDYSSRIFLTAKAKPIGFSNLFFPCFALFCGLAAASTSVLVEKLQSYLAHD